MKRQLIGLGVVGLLAVGAVAYAQSPDQGSAPAETSSGAKSDSQALPREVFGHVGDSRTMEFGSPLSAHAVEFELPSIPHAFGLKWLDLSITKHLVWLWVAAVLVLLIFGLGRSKSITPKGFGVVVEMLVLFIRDEVAKPSIGEKEYRRYTPYLCTTFFFILVANLLGVVPWVSTPTGDAAVTAGLALCTFALTQVAAVRSAGVWGFIKHLTGGVHWLLWPIMIPIEILGIFAKPFALCLRLFANMIAGHIVIFYLLGLIFIFKSMIIAPVSVTLAVCMFLLEIFVCFLQAYIFTILSAVFIGLAVSSGHHDDAEHAHDGATAGATH